MIQSNELRIGNYVKVYLGVNDLGADYKVRKIENFYENGVHIGFGKCFKFNEIEPIPLTENWHNKFGVNKNGFNNFEYELPNTISIHVKVIFTHEYVMLRQSRSHNMHEDDIIIIWNKDIKKRDMFVYEWQNLYFALTGKELSYDPNR